MNDDETIEILGFGLFLLGLIAFEFWLVFGVLS
jgi:hypothetical protein